MSLPFDNLYFEVARRVPFERLEEWLDFFNNCIDKGEDVPLDLAELIRDAWFLKL